MIVCIYFEGNKDWVEVYINDVPSLYFLNRC